MQPELYHDRARGLLVYKTSEPACVLEHVPEARQVNGAYVAMPANLRNIQLLRTNARCPPLPKRTSGPRWSK